MKADSTYIESSDVQKLLEEVGLTDTEARIYVAGCSVDSITVQEIGVRTGVKRPTIYHALHTLTEKGLVVEHARNGKSAFRMEAPGRLLGWIELQKDALAQKEDAVQALVEQLAVHAPSTGGDVQVEHYTDAKSVQAVIDLAFYARSKQCVIVVPSKDFFEGLEERSRDAEHRGVQVRVIVKKVDSALLIYDGKTVIVENLSKATVISSAALASALSILL